MVETPDSKITLGSGRELPLFSLYGEHREPADRHLELIDTLVVDLPDIGCRVYTYMTTLAGCLRAAARRGKRVVVLDRPNPLGLVHLSTEGVSYLHVEGNVIEPHLKSFVGWYAIPMRHGLTLGELGRLFVLDNDLRVDFEVVEVSGLRRSMDPRDYDALLPRMASPNMPGPWTMSFFPVSVPLEGCNISEGRGTTAPFQSIGAPFIDENNLSEAIAEAFEHLGLQAAAEMTWRPHRFSPSFDKFSGSVCRGIFLKHTGLLSRATFDSSIALLGALIKSAGQEFHWRQPGYEYDFEHPPIDLILGNARWRGLLENLRGHSTAAHWEAIRAELVDAAVQAQGFARKSAAIWIYS
jgi:uncharacterized protein YbbC (DUF1343 family)